MVCLLKPIAGRRAAPAPTTSQPADAKLLQGKLASLEAHWLNVCNDTTEKVAKSKSSFSTRPGTCAVVIGVGVLSVGRARNRSF